ncbi:MAG: hypothetical protein JKY50_00740 [Oleispira sp.]|nr:hypothetical protein [Oleispira sp.]
MKRNQSFNAKVVIRNNGLSIGDTVCLKPSKFRPWFDTVLLYAEIDRQTGADTGVYIDANELKNNFELVES